METLGQNVVGVLVQSLVVTTNVLQHLLGFRIELRFLVGLFLFLWPRRGDGIGEKGWKHFKQEFHRFVHAVGNAHVGKRIVQVLFGHRQPIVRSHFGRIGRTRHPTNHVDLELAHVLQPVALHASGVEETIVESGVSKTFGILLAPSLAAGRVSIVIIHGRQALVGMAQQSHGGNHQIIMLCFFRRNAVQGLEPGWQGP